MTDYNNQAYPYAQAANLHPERIGSGGHVPPQEAILAGKRPRRTRSTQGAAHYGNGQKGKKGPGANSTKVEYHDRRTAAPIFLQKTFEMINRCHSQSPNLAGWTDDGKMFVIKDQNIFAREIIPQFFDHNKFTSFARQLNFYGFRKMQSRAIYKGDVNKETAKYVTFFNEKFQRDRADLLKEIQRSTKGGQNTNQNQELQKEISVLKQKVSQLESSMQMMQTDFSDRLAALETQMYQFASYSAGSHSMSYQDRNNSRASSGGKYNLDEQGQYPTPEKVEQSNSNKDTSRPTLAPHPNSKVLPDTRVLPAPPRQQSNMRYDSFLRGLSQTSLPDMAPFEQKYFQNIVTGPDPVDNDPNDASTPPRGASNNGSEPLPKLDQPNLTRQISEGFQRMGLNLKDSGSQKLDFSLKEYPPLSSGV